MKNAFAILIVTILITSCGQKLGDYYFDFDQIDHYFIEIDEGELFDRIEDSDLTTEQRLQQGLIIDDTQSDTLFIAKLEKIGFHKNKITGGKIRLIKEIFREKYHKETLATSCVAVYRDLFIFRKKGKIVGMAKICFSCLQHQIHGTDASTFQFGQSGDYDNLKSILNRK